MAHYQSILSYDGTDFHGFQRQVEGIRTVQSAVETALERLGWSQPSITAAGRTDAGVHARGQVVGYELDWAHDLPTLTRALNSHLPPDVAAQSSQEVEANVHPRFSAHWRHYRYRLIEAEQRNPLRERFAQRIWPPADLNALEMVGTSMKGRHDFRAFGPAPIEGGHTVRSVHLLTWARDGGYLQMDIVADAFLQHMVRRVVAASLEVAAGRVEVAETARLIDAPVERWEGPLAKPGGLFLMRVGYQPWAGPGSIEGPEEGGNKDNERPEDLLP